MELTDHRCTGRRQREFDRETIIDNHNTAQTCGGNYIMKLHNAAFKLLLSPSRSFSELERPEVKRWCKSRHQLSTNLKSCPSWEETQLLFTTPNNCPVPSCCLHVNEWKQVMQRWQQVNYTLGCISTFSHENMHIKDTTRLWHLPQLFVS